MFLNNYNKKRIGIVVLLEAIYIISALNPASISRCIAVLTYQGPVFTVHFRYNEQLRSIVLLVQAYVHKHALRCQLHGRRYSHHRCKQ
jgi:hypothetical protein